MISKTFNCDRELAEDYRDIFEDLKKKLAGSVSLKMEPGVSRDGMAIWQCEFTGRNGDYAIFIDEDYEE